MAYIKHPEKFMKVKLAELGGVVTSRTKNKARWHSTDGTQYTFPDGHTVFVRKDISMRNAESLLSDTYVHFGMEPLEAKVVPVRDTTPRPPVINLNRLVATVHAQQRLKLMRSQQGVRSSELLEVIQHPERVTYSEHHSSWVWYGHRVALAIVNEAGRSVITTVLWARQDLWAENPRPEKATS